MESQEEEIRRLAKKAQIAGQEFITALENDKPSIWPIIVAIGLAALWSLWITYIVYLAIEKGVF